MNSIVDAPWTEQQRQAELDRLRLALKTASDQLAMAAGYLSHSNQNHKAKWVLGWSDDARRSLGAISPE